MTFISDATSCYWTNAVAAVAADAAVPTNVADAVDAVLLILL